MILGSELACKSRTAARRPQLRLFTMASMKKQQQYQEVGLKMQAALKSGGLLELPELGGWGLLRL